MSESIIVFEQDYPAFVLIFSILLWIGLLAREWRRQNKNFRTLRLVLSTLVVISILGLIHQPALKKSVSKSNLLLVTDGATSFQIDSVRRANNRLDILRLDSTLANYPDLSRFGKVTVLGSGIPEYDLWRIEGVNASFVPAKLPNGLLRLNVLGPTEVNREVEIRGEFKTSENTSLVLSGPEGKIDSVTVGRENSLFELAFVPKSVGNIIYELSSGEMNERIPVNIIPNQSIKVLLINAFPTFEIRNLKNYLARRGNEVIVRNQVSKDTYRFEFFNTTERRVDRLTQQELKNQDLVIMDWQSLSQLPRNEQSLLRTAIREEGLGVFILPEEAVFGRNQWINLQTTPNSEDKATVQYGANAAEIDRYNFDLTASSRQFGTLESENGESLAINQLEGLGKIGTTILKDIYRQNLNGDSIAYASIWSELLNGVAKQNTSSTTVTLQDQVTYPLEPMTLNFQSPIGIGEVLVNGEKVALEQDPQIPEQWRGTYWPDQAGWHQVVAEGDSSAFYVYQKGEWSAKRSHDRTQVNQAFFANNQSIDLEGQFQYEKIAELWFYLVFLLSAGFLWFEPKV